MKYTLTIMAILTSMQCIGQNGATKNIYTDYSAYITDSSKNGWVINDPTDVLFPDSIYFRSSTGVVSRNRLEMIGTLNNMKFSPLWSFMVSDPKNLRWTEKGVGAEDRYLDSIYICYKYLQHRATDNDIIQIDLVDASDNSGLKTSEGYPLYTLGVVDKIASIEWKLNRDDQTESFFGDSISDYRCVYKQLEGGPISNFPIALAYRVRYRPGYQYSINDTVSLDSSYSGGKNINPFVPLIVYAKTHSLMKSYSYACVQNDPMYNGYNSTLKPAWFEGPDSFPVAHLGFGIGSEVSLLSVRKNNEPRKLAIFKDAGYLNLHSNAELVLEVSLVNMRGQTILTESLLPHSRIKIPTTGLAKGIYCLRSNIYSTKLVID